jgi:pSer/pThr/pTyr-binding forkhead associated (FHA) protein
MIQLHVLSGKKAGNRMVVRRFPFSIGRASESDLQCDDDGVWNRHLALNWKGTEGFFLEAAPDALAAVNHQPVRTSRLRNGDLITFGSVKIQFWLAAVRQRGLRLRELCVWTLLLAVTLGQFALIYWLLGTD